MAVVDRNLDRRSPSTRAATRAAAEAFVQYLFTPAAQREFSACGFRWSLRRLLGFHSLPQA